MGAACAETAALREQLEQARTEARKAHEAAEDLRGGESARKAGGG